MIKALQAKHIPDTDILRVIDETRAVHDRWTSLYILEAELPHLPSKVIRAKCASLIRRRIISGCACGCRGDFERVELNSS